MALDLTLRCAVGMEASAIHPAYLRNSLYSENEVCNEVSKNGLTPQLAEGIKPFIFKLIKAYLHIKMSQVRLSSLDIQSTESQRLDDVDTDMMIETFARIG